MEEFKIPMPPSESGADSSDQKTADPSAPSPMSLDSDMPADRKLTLVSKDQQNFEVKLSHACISTLIKTSLETGQSGDELSASQSSLSLVVSGVVVSLDVCGRCALPLLLRGGDTCKVLHFSLCVCVCATSADKTAESVPIPGVKSDVMVEILKYMDYHKGTEPPIIDKPLRSKVMKDVCKTQFDADFIDAIGENRQLLYDLILVQFDLLLVPPFVLFAWA